MSVDVQSLQQKIEFLEFQLEDYQRREAHHKEMYESLLASLSTAPDSEVVEQPKEPVQTQVTQELEELRHSHEKQVNELTQKLQEVETHNRELDFNLRNQKLMYEQTILDLKQQVFQIDNEKSHLSWKVKLLTTAEEYSPLRSKDDKQTEGLRKQIRDLNADIESGKAACNAEVTAIRSQAAETLASVKGMYEEEQLLLKQQVVDLQKQLRYQSYRDKEAQDLSTEDTSEVAEETSDTSVLVACRLRDQLKEKTMEVDQLQRALRLKVLEQRNGFSCKDCHRLLEEKEKQVEELKRQAGELRIQMSSPMSLKPPSPSHSRAVSHSPRPIDSHLLDSETKPEAPTPFSPQLRPAEDLEQLRLFATYQRMIRSCSRMECEHCKNLLNTTEFHDHVLVCRLEAINASHTSPRRSKRLDETARLEDRVKALKLKIGQLRNERDRARLESERMLMQLKNVKLDWAISEERNEEREMQLKINIRQTVQVLYKVRDTHLYTQNRDLEEVLLYLRELCKESRSTVHKS